MLLLCCVLGIIFAGAYVKILPELFRCLLSPRSAGGIESSVRLSRDRNILALSLFPAAMLLAWWCRLINPDWMVGLGPGARMWLVGAILAAYVLLRVVMDLVLQPRRSSETWTNSSHAFYTFFILGMSLLLPSFGILFVCGASPEAIRLIIIVEIILVYSVFLIRRAQILLQSFATLTTFLYLCGLELLPTGILVATSTLL